MSDPLLRPLLPGEFVSNEDGSRSTERTVTVPGPDGRWMLVPSLWMSKSGPRDLRPIGDDAIAAVAEGFARASGQNFPTFPTQAAADGFARYRSQNGGATEQPLTAVQQIAKALMGNGHR